MVSQPSRIRGVLEIFWVEGNCWISDQIEWAWVASTRPLHHVEVNHGCFDAGVAHEVLNGADVGAAMEQMCRE